MVTHILRTLIFIIFIISAVASANEAQSDDCKPVALVKPNLVNAANAPISTVLQVRLQDTYPPEFTNLDGHGNTFSIALTMPLPEYRLLPFHQL